MQTDKDKHIQQLLEQHDEDMLTIRAIQLVMEDFMAKQKELEQKMADLIKNHDALNKQCEQLQAERYQLPVCRYRSGTSARGPHPVA